MSLQNDRLLIRPTQPEDIAFVLQAEKEDENRNFITPYAPEEHLKELASSTDIIEHLVIEDKKKGEKKGFVILHKDQANRSLEFKRIVVTEKGKGIGRNSLRLIKKYGFEQLQFHRIWLDVFDYNSRALHLYKSEGFVEEGKLVESIFRNGQYHNLLILSMLQCEYRVVSS